MSFWSKLFGSVPENLYIFIVGIIAAGCFGAVCWCDREVKKNFGEWKSEHYYSRKLYSLLTVCYTMFLTLITVFPLLGMFGTVKALLTLDLSGEGGVLGARSSFFDALTSTAWGIIFACVFKVLNAVIATRTDDNIHKITELIDSKAANIDEDGGRGRRAGKRGR